MRKSLLLMLSAIMALPVTAQIEDWGDATVITNTYADRISPDGSWVTGTTFENGCVLYGIDSDSFKYFPYGTNGNGNCLSNTGWVVGSKQVDNDNYPALVMTMDGEFTPDVFPKNVSGNIHGITPDGSRVCGNVGNNGAGLMLLPFYCDIDANGNFSELKYLPYPKLDPFGEVPISASATWISEDGKLIAGQVRDTHGFYIYPIIYKQDTDGQWDYYLPAEKLFNTLNLPIPEPIKEIEYYFPDAPYPEVKDFMTEKEYQEFQLAGTPYDDLINYMTPEEYEAYNEADEKYLEAQIAYEYIFGEYMDQYWAIVDCSLNCVYNNLAMDVAGTWIAAGSQKELLVESNGGQSEWVTHYVPFIYNIETDEWHQIAPDTSNYLVTQIHAGGTTIINTPGGTIPSRSFVYVVGSEELVPINEFLEQDNPGLADWYAEYDTTKIIIGYDPETGEYEYTDDMILTGKAMMSRDFSRVAAGVDGYYLNYDMYFTYIFTGLTSGVEEIPIDSLKKDGNLKVFNLQGVKVMESRNKNAIKSLPQGIYIINGKKVAI